MQQHIFLAYNLHVAFKREPAKSEVFYLEFLLEQTKIVVWEFMLVQFELSARWGGRNSKKNY